MLLKKNAEYSTQTPIQIPVNSTVICYSCKLEKSKNLFHKNKSRSNGLSALCKECVRQYQKTHKQKIRQSTKKWKANNKEKIQTYAKQYNAAHRTAINLWSKKWKKRNPLAVRAMKARRRAREMNAEGFYAHKTIEDLYVKQQGKCVCCGIHLERKFQVDHIIPLSRGGSNFPSNLQLLTPACNQSKNAKTMEEYMKSKLGGME